ncbi:2-keto-4-pentenoate hydratase [Thermocatellispora tengchongensis]|uniref:2-keto-4-pentenoate hydratase n=1 Tax=Thermocatellispora tengchongensis TaxID=1073253 RepID=A0A840PEE9_9ACTN|nr:2-keto-4-pentenoate hydratase [Thermocatellispora tengchongensis]MBB5137126.1 2-keto-4-pentenoate hydratase [Thermocatellispora tengchongensis]
MDPGSADKAAAELLAAYASGNPIQPLTTTYPDLSVEDAYAIQRAQIEVFLERGARIKGHKVGLTSAAMQRQLGVDQPDYGHLLDTMFHLDGAPIDTGRFIQPRIEPEIAFVLRRPLAGPGVTAADAVAAVDFVLPALEIIDSRIADWRITLADTIADNASSGGVVLGNRPVRLDAVDLVLAGCLLHRNGALIDTGAGGAVLGSPLNALVWLANVLGEQGVTLEAGHVVLPGSITAAIPVAPGDVVTATLAGIGTVTARFAAEEAR